MCRWNVYSKLLGAKIYVGTFLKFLLVLGVVKNSDAQIEKNSVKKLIAFFKNNTDVCNSSGCQDAAELIRGNIDESVDPCKNFYQFACGGFIKKINIPSDQESVSRVSIMHEKVMEDMRQILAEEINPDEPRIFGLAKDYYKACMDTSTVEDLGLKPLLEIINQLDGWPVVLGDAWNENSFNWMDTSIKLRQLGYPQKYILSVFVFNDVLNTSSNILYITEGEPQVKLKIVKGKFGNDGGIQAYHRYMLEVAVLLGADKERASLELKKVIEFEALLTLLASEKHDYTKSTLIINTIQDLEIQLPFIPWLNFLNNITEPIAHLKPSDKVNVEKPFYLYNLQYALSSLDNRTLANYLVWRAVADSVPYLSNEIRQKYSGFLKEYNSYNDEIPTEPRWKECIRLVTSKENGIPVGISSLYVRRFFQDETRKDVQRIVNSIIEEFQLFIRKVSWMDDETKKLALRKSLFMQYIIGYPNELLNDTIIDSYSLKLHVNPKEHFRNVLRAYRFHYDDSLSGLNALSSEHKWTRFSNAVSINAYYNAISNTFVLLAAILQPPIFDPSWPRNVKYGSVGFIIAHEIMHAFDSERFMFDETGSFKEWFSDESLREFYKRLECYVIKYEQYFDKRVGLNINGSLTIDENLADNVGLRVSHAAYKKWERQAEKQPRLPGLKYTAEQIFWISSVNFLCSKETSEHRLLLLLTAEHTPDFFRVLGEISNSGDFARAFDCPKDSPMNPQEKCKLL